MSIFKSVYLFALLQGALIPIVSLAQDDDFDAPAIDEDMPPDVPSPSTPMSNHSSSNSGSSIGGSEKPAGDDEKKVPEDDGYTDPIVYSPSEKKAACRKYEGKYISYYENVYRIEKCLVREIQASDLILKINKQGVTITPVDGDVLAKLEKGSPILEGSQKKIPARSCKQLERKYITFAYTDVYYVDHCKKRVFPEWTAFVEHRKRAKRQKDEVIALTYPEFIALAVGEVMPSMIDEEYKKQRIMSKSVDIIAIDVACKGLNGKDVSYVDRIYKIENCRKRAYDPELFLRKRQASAARLVEISSEQWISIPEGKPIDLSDPKPKAKKPK